MPRTWLPIDVFHRSPPAPKIEHIVQHVQIIAMRYNAKVHTISNLALPKRNVEFIETMDRAPVTKLKDGPA